MDRDDVKEGMHFESRDYIVKVRAVGPYSATCTIEATKSKRARKLPGMELRLWLKQLVDESRWLYIPEEVEKPKEEVPDDVEECPNCGGWIVPGCICDACGPDPDDY